jgi:mono/diheme cytochrome c family protein
MSLSSTLRFQLSGLFGVTFLAVLLAGCGSDSKEEGMNEGKEEVEEHACQSCHGMNMAGVSTSPAPGSTAAYAPNLTPDAETGIAEWSTDQIVTAILTGVDDEGETLCAVMPRFGSLNPPMSMDEAKAIAAYLKSLPAVKNSVMESMCAERK